MAPAVIQVQFILLINFWLTGIFAICVRAQKGRPPPTRPPVRSASNHAREMPHERSPARRRHVTTRRPSVLCCAVRLFPFWRTFPLLSLSLFSVSQLRWYLSFVLHFAFLVLLITAVAVAVAVGSVRLPPSRYLRLRFSFLSPPPPPLSRRSRLASPATAFPASRGRHFPVLAPPPRPMRLSPFICLVPPGRWRSF